MEPMTALMVMNTCVSVMRAFSGGGDNGLGAALRATTEALVSLNRQLGRVQEELGRLAQAVGNLPAQFEGLQEMQYVKERIWTIQAQAGLWREIIGSDSNINFENFSPRQINDLENVRTTSKSSRADLSFNSPGETALAATVATVALALETSSEMLLGGTENTQRRILESYKEWLTHIQDKNRTTSAAANLVNLEAQIAGKKQQLGNLMDVPLAEFPPEWEGYFTPTRLVGTCWAASWTIPLHHFTMPGARAGLYVYWTISSGRQDGVRQWVLHAYTDKTTNDPAKRPAWMGGAPSIDGIACVLVQRHPAITAAGLEAEIQQGDWFRSQEERVERGMAITDELNLLEARAEFHRRAIAVSIETSHQVDRWLMVLR